MVSCLLRTERRKEKRRKIFELVLEIPPIDSLIKFMIYELFWFVTAGGIFHGLRVLCRLDKLRSFPVDRPDPEKDSRDR